MNQHHLRTFPEPFAAVRAGLRTADHRYILDRNFAVGDTLLLEEYLPETQSYTGEVERRVVTQIDRGPNFGIRAGYGVLSYASEAHLEYLQTALAVGARP